jgi:hypothetical protein
MRYQSNQLLKNKEHPKYLPGLGWFAVPPKGPVWGAYMEVALPALAALAALLLSTNHLLEGPENFQLGFKIALALLFFIGTWTEGLSFELAIFLVPISGISAQYVDPGPLPPIVYMFLALFAGKMIGLLSEGFFEGEPSLAERRPSFLISAPVFAASGMVLVGYILFAWRLTEFHGISGVAFSELTVNTAGLSNIEAIKEAAVGPFSLFCGLAAVYWSMRFDWNRGWKYILPAFALGTVVATVFAYKDILLGSDSLTPEFCGYHTAAVFLPLTIAIFVSYFVKRGKSILGMVLLSILLGPAIYFGANALTEAITICAAVLALLAMRRSERFARSAKYLTAVALAAILVTFFLPAAPIPSDTRDAGEQQQNIIESLIGRFPLTGTGAGSFAIEFENEAARFDLTPSDLPTQTHLPANLQANLPANLHNALFAELGIFGVGAILMIFIVLVVRALNRKSLAASPPWLFDALIAGVVSAFFIARALPPTMASGTCIFIGLCLGAIESQRAEARRQDVRRAGFFVVFPMVISVLIYGAILADLSTGPLDVSERAITAGRSPEKGFFAWESLDSEPAFRWMSQKAQIPIEADTKNITLELATEMPGIENKPQVLSFYLDNRNIFSEYFYNKDWRRVRIEIPSGDGGRRALTLQSSRTFNPAALQLSEDYRDLSVRMRITTSE